jgi:hypothetical protein
MEAYDGFSFNRPISKSQVTFESPCPDMVPGRGARSLTVSGGSSGPGDPATARLRPMGTTFPCSPHAVPESASKPHTLFPEVPRPAKSSNREEA